MKVIGTIVFLEVFSFAFCLRQLGLYQDDWAILDHLYTGSGFSFWHGCKTLWAAGVIARPLSIPIYSALYAIGGFSPLPYHLALLAANALAAIAFYIWLERLTGDRRLALLAAALGVVYPAHPATHHLATHILQPLAHALALAALTVHVSWLERRTRRAGLLCGALFAAGFLAKESVAFLPLLGVAAACARSRAHGDDGRTTLRRLPIDMLPLAAAFGFGLLWQWVIKSQQPLSVHWSLHWTRVVYVSALKSLTLETFQLLRLTGWAFLSAADDARLLLLGLFSATASLLLLKRERETRPFDKRAVPLLLALAAANFAAGYLPYAASGAYQPQVVGAMSRTNEIGSWSAALLLAMGLRWGAGRAAAQGKTAHAALITGLGFLLAACTWTNWYIAQQWAGSWSLQQDVLTRVVRWAPRLPPGATLLVTGVPHYVNGIEVFHEGYGNWAFSYAFKLKTGRSDVNTVLPTGTLAGTPSGVVESDGGRVIRTISYSDLYQYQYELPADKLTRVVP